MTAPRPRLDALHAAIRLLRAEADQDKVFAVEHEKTAKFQTAQATADWFRRMSTQAIIRAAQLDAVADWLEEVTDEGRMG